jgi:hypothetical protein
MMSTSVIVNQIGFRPDDPFKRAVMPLGVQTTGYLGAFLFKIVHVSQFIQHPLNSPGGRALFEWRQAVLEDTPLGRYAVCDLSEITTRGGYQIFSDAGASQPFLIYRDAWKRCFRLLLEWYRIASCGEAVPGYHERCHLDDCRLTSNGKHVDLVGGWHDAGDLRKWTSTMALVSQRLADFVEEQGRDLEGTGVDPELVWHQLERGASYLLKTVDPASGLAWHNVASEGDNSCNVWTDNVPGTSDDRHVDPAIVMSTQHTYVQAQCALSRVLRERNPDLGARALASARAVWQRLPEPSCSTESLGTLLELWRTTHERPFREQAVSVLRSLLDRQCTGARFGQDRIRGFLLEGDEVAFNGGFLGRGGRNIFAHMTLVEHLSRALLIWPEDGDATRWRDGLILLLEGLMEPMMRLSPYRTLPACFYAAGSGPANGRPLKGDLVFRYFGDEAEGNNNGLLDGAAALALAARALGQPRWAAYGQKQMEWVLGFNPFETSMLTGLGYNHASPFSYYVGQIPGGIINGFKGDAHDNPALGMNREMEAMLMEYWSVHTAAMMRALAVLENEPLR